MLFTLTIRFHTNVQRSTTQLIVFLLRILFLDFFTHLVLGASVHCLLETLEAGFCGRDRECIGVELSS